jgi:hypothetical protein
MSSLTLAIGIMLNDYRSLLRNLLLNNLGGKTEEELQEDIRKCGRDIDLLCEMKRAVASNDKTQIMKAALSVHHLTPFLEYTAFLTDPGNQASYQLW